MSEGAPRHARVSIPPRAHRASATCPSEHPLTTGRGGEPSPQHQAAKCAARRAGAAETPLGGGGQQSRRPGACTAPAEPSTCREAGLRGSRAACGFAPGPSLQGLTFGSTSAWTTGRHLLSRQRARGAAPRRCCFAAHVSHGCWGAAGTLPDCPARSLCSRRRGQPAPGHGAPGTHASPESRGPSRSHRCVC